jgi:lipid-binding SYLF domain-containing protein
LKFLSLFLCGLALTTALSGCTTTIGSSAQDRRQAVLTMEKDALASLYKIQPLAKSEMEAAPGYAVFSNANVNLIFASFGGGYGVVTDKAGKQTFMKMGEVGLGLGLGVKDFRAVFIFHDRATMDRFIKSGWEFGGQADAAAIASDKGAAVAGEAVVDGITIYQLTKSGLALQATVKGTKYWQDADLN